MATRTVMGTGSLLGLLHELETSSGDLYARWCPDCGFYELSEDEALLHVELPCPRCEGNE